MGSLYRSAEMDKVQLFLQTEAAYACVAELGELGLVQFRDLNEDVNSFQRKFVNEVRRCDEMERKLRFFDNQIQEAGIPTHETEQNPDAPKPREMVDLEATFDQLESELQEINANDEKLRKSQMELTELRHILTKTQAFFDEREDIRAVQELQEAQQLEGYNNPTLDIEGDPAAIAAEKEKHSDLKFVAGVIKRERENTFERLLWRACRGNIFFKKDEIEEPLIDPTTRDLVHKSVFIIFFQGGQLKTRIKKICDAFKATLYPCPENPAERRSMTMGVLTRLDDIQKVIDTTTKHRTSNLKKMAKKIRAWFAKVRKMKAIYHTLNKFSVDVTEKCLIAEAWCPRDDMEKINLALKRGTDQSGSLVPSIINKVETDEMPPTFHRVNKFTRGFQGIVDAYGVADYRECNPAPYTIISFPFLFAIMFGDAGHGMIMLFAALALILAERKLAAMKIKDEIFNTFFNGRYIIILMGMFSMYTGSIYNEMYARSINVFGTTWTTSYFNTTVLTGNAEAKYQLVPETSYSGSAFPFGFDPVWNIALNKITFTDSFKMKMSVIIGVTQMTFGVFLSLMNYTYRKSWLDVFTVFLPQLVFLSCIFIYLCLQIIMKWVSFSVFTATNVLGVGLYQGPHCAPSLLIGLINMFMFKSRMTGFVYNGNNPNAACWNNASCAANGTVAPCCKEHPDCALQEWYMGQNEIEKALVIFAVLSIPIMLLVKPLVLRSRNKALVAAQGPTVHVDISSDDVSIVSNGKNAKNGTAKKQNGHASSSEGHGGPPPFEFSEVFIHQIIHTIEFCLGCISHTASYLRLWALSLAHAELSEVLWSMVLRNGFKMVSGYGGIIAIYLVFWAFSALTVAVLILMEGLSAFLHTLRLHWVEFQSKFYSGTGYLFEPFCFDAILEAYDE